MKRKMHEVLEARVARVHHIPVWNWQRTNLINKELDCHQCY